MKQTLKTIILIMPILMAVNTFGQHQNQVKMEQNNREEYPITDQVAVIDKINIPKKAIVAYSEKSLFIRNTLRQQPGFIKYEIFQLKDDNGNLKVVTIATWANQKYLDDAILVIKEAMNKAGINMPSFLEKNGIIMERDIYIPVEE